MLERSVDRQIMVVAGLVLLLDQVTKQIVVELLAEGSHKVVFDGFFRFVHWANTGAGFSILHDRNSWLAGLSVLAVCALWYLREQYVGIGKVGPIALGFVFGGILGNLADRVLIEHVIDFLRFYIYRRGGGEIGFPAFNVADMGICIGVGLLILAAIRARMHEFWGRILRLFHTHLPSEQTQLVFDGLSHPPEGDSGGNGNGKSNPSVAKSGDSSASARTELGKPDA